MSTTAAEARRMLAGHTIWLWHYLHADWQWVHSRAWHAERYAHAFRYALDLMRQHPDIKYYFDTASEYFEAVYQRLTPQQKETLHQYVREGRVRIVSAQVSNPRPTQVGDETYLRNLQLGRAYFQETLPPTDLSLFHSVDISIGHTQMPQILNLAGFKYYKAWRPHGAMNAHGIPHQFIWQGLDGSCILVTRGSYGGMWMTSQLPDTYKTDWDAALVKLFDQMFRDQLWHDRSPSKHLWMIQGSDDALLLRTLDGDQHFDLLDFIRQWNQREAAPIRWCTPLEYSQAVAERADTLKVVEGVLDGVDVGYNVANGGSNGLWHWRQMNDRRLLRAEWWAAAAVSVGFAYPHDELRKIWRQHLTYQAHATEFAFKEDLAYLLGLAGDVRFHAENIEREALTAIAQAAGGGDPMTHYLFNPHPWPLEADVEIYHPCLVGGIGDIEVVDERGQRLPQQPLRTFLSPRDHKSLDDQTRLVRLTLPPLGYTRVRVVEKTEPAPSLAAPPEDGVVTTPDLRLTFRDHALREVRDRASGTTWFSRDGASWPRLAFHVLDNQNWVFGGSELRREVFMPQRSQWLHSGPLRWVHRSKGRLGPYEAEVDTIVADRGREVQIAVRLEGHWRQAPVTGFVTLLADVDAGGQVMVDIPFGVEPRDPDREIYAHNVPADAELGNAAMFERLRPGFFWGRSWADWSGKGKGLTFFSVDGCYYWFKEPGQFGHILLRCLNLVPGSWEEYCGEHLTGTGVHTFRYALRFHNGDWRQADPQRRSQELRHPVREVRPLYPNPTARLPASHSFLALDGSAILSAYYRQDGHLLVRFYESEGRGGEVTLRLPTAPASVQAVNLLDEVVDVPVRLNGNAVTVTVRPWQIVTLRLR